MNHGNKTIIILTLFFFQLNQFLSAEEKILSSPLINLDKLKPSFEVTDDKNETIFKSQKLKNKKKRM